MLSKRRRLTVDFETRSEAELKKTGAYKYSLHPSTRATCLAFKPHGAPTQLIPFERINEPWRTLPGPFRGQWLWWIKQGFEFSAHNAFFDRCIYQNVLVKRLGWPDIPERQFRCTAAKAAACALPRDLAGAGAALHLSVQKDKTGTAAVMATCKPQKKYKDYLRAVEKVQAGRRVAAKTRALAEGPKPEKFRTPQSDPEIFAHLYSYCKIDVLAQERIDDILPDLIPSEQEIWFLNQKQNLRGLLVDVPVAKKIVTIMAREEKKKTDKLDKLTMGLVASANSRKQILEWLELEGVVLPDIKAKTVDDFLKAGGISDDAMKLLEIRKALSKTSTKKYASLLDRASEYDHRVRDITLYHGASTGRDSGTGFQPHNLPRPLISQDEIEHVFELLRTANPHDESLVEYIEYFIGPVGLVFSSLLRGMIIPSPNKELYVADFAKVEVAVLWWLANNWPGLKVLNSGKDPYLYMAAANTGKTYKEVERAYKNDETWAADARQLGKAQVLGCGFGMGAEKFQLTAWDSYRLKLKISQSKNAVEVYRTQNSAVKDLWSKYELAFSTVINNKKQIVKIGKCTFHYSAKFLWVTLPSGRRLAYREPSIIKRQSEWGERDSVAYWAVSPKNKKKWVQEFTWGGKIAENITQAVARDLMMPAMQRFEAAGYEALLSIHDEALTESVIGEGDFEHFKKIMCARPKWADEYLPLDAGGWVGHRYRK